MTVLEKVYTPLPRQGDICPVSGLKRGMLLQLAQDRKITSVHLRKPGAKRGSRLINVESLLAYLESQETAAE
jgi:hypothetical protein